MAAGAVRHVLIRVNRIDPGFLIGYWTVYV